MGLRAHNFHLCISQQRSPEAGITVKLNTEPGLILHQQHNIASSTELGLIGVQVAVSHTSVHIEAVSKLADYLCYEA